MRGFFTVDLYALVDKCFIYTRVSPWAAVLRFFFTSLFACLFMIKIFRSKKFNVPARLSMQDVQKLTEEDVEDGGCGCQ